MRVPLSLHPQAAYPPGAFSCCLQAIERADADLLPELHGQDGHAQCRASAGRGTAHLTPAVPDYEPALLARLRTLSPTLMRRSLKWSGSMWPLFLLCDVLCKCGLTSSVPALCVMLPLMFCCVCRSISYAMTFCRVLMDLVTRWLIRWFCPLCGVRAPLDSLGSLAACLRTWDRGISASRQEAAGVFTPFAFFLPLVWILQGLTSSFRRLLPRAPPFGPFPPVPCAPLAATGAGLRLAWDGLLPCSRWPLAAGVATLPLASSGVPLLCLGTGSLRANMWLRGTARSRSVSPVELSCLL